MEILKKDDLRYYVVDNFPTIGVRFIDLTPTLMDANSLHMIAGRLNLLNHSDDIDYIISPEARGFIWGSLIAYKNGLPLIIARKKGKIPKEVAGYGIEYQTEYSVDYLEIHDIDLTGKKVMYVDDVYATGGTYEVCKTLVEQSGGKLVKGLVIYDVGINNNDEIKSLYRGDDL